MSSSPKTSQAFVHLHLHSAYSLLEGAIHIGALADLCRAGGMPAVALTDDNNLFGALEASETLSAAGIQPIIGARLSLPAEGFGLKRPRRGAGPSLVLLAQNETGYRNLLELVSAAHLEPADKGGASVTPERIFEASEGLICLSGGPSGAFNTLIIENKPDAFAAFARRVAQAFPDRLYIELQRHGLGAEDAAEGRLIDHAYENGLPLVATNEPYFPSKDYYEAHDALLCVADGSYVYEEERRRLTPEHYFKSAQEMRALFSDLPEAADNTVEIARRCAFRPRTHPPILPNFTAGGADEAGELSRQAQAGLRERLARHEPAAPEAEYWSRLEHELTIINKMGFPGYFLIVADFIQWAKARNIPVGPGRGSGAGSVVAWALTITDIDPLRFGLLFERFLNPERVSMPDFDVDFCQDRRDEVIRYVQDRYGADRVAQIITFGKLQARAVLRDVGRVLGMPYGQVDRLCKMVPNNPANPTTLSEAIETESRLREARDDEPEVADLLDKSLKLEGLYRHASTHAAGLVIGDRPLSELVPLYRDPRSDMPVTQFNMKWVEPAGLVKFDFLGLKTLTVLQRAAEMLAERGVEIDLSALPLSDEKTFEMLGEGASVGVFQLESAGMRSTLKAMKPDSLEDIIALVSLYRPGPMENIPAYIDCKFGRSEPDYLHPMLEGILKETYGVIIYQEQVMQIAQVLSGYSLGEADLLRRAMGKKKKEEMDKQKVRFIDGARANGVDEAKADAIFELVAKFAGYGFNKSHAAAYAFIAYQTAYLKANYPAEFLAASMSLDRHNTDKLAVFLEEAKRLCVSVAGPDANRSRADFAVENNVILYALSALKNVGYESMRALQAAREAGGPFRDLGDFARRIDPVAVGKRAVENISRAGAFDSLGVSRAEALAGAERVIALAQSACEEKNSSQSNLFGDAAEDALKLELPKCETWTSLEMLDEERAAMGFYFSGHPLDDYEATLKRMNVVTSRDAAQRAAAGGGVSLLMAGVVRGVRRRRSKTGRPFAWVQLSDRTGEFEATVFSETLNRDGHLLEEGTLVLASAVAEDRDGDARFLFDGLRPLDEAAAGASASLRIYVAKADAFSSIRKRLEDEAARAQGAQTSRKGAGGAVSVVLALTESAREVEIKLPGSYAISPAFGASIKAVRDVLDIEYL